MGKTPDFDIQKAHRYFSADCFNRAWDEIDKSSRTCEDDERMLLLAMASLWHWSQREDATPVNNSIGYWQVARVYALLGKGDEALAYGKSCLEVLKGDDTLPFYSGYAYEAMARAEMVTGRKSEMEQNLQLARQEADKVTSSEEKGMLMKDLETIR